MGKRKSAKKQQTKKGPPPLATTFDCIICSGERKININMDKKARRAHLACAECNVEWSRVLESHEDPVDVYYTWIDAAEELRLQSEAKRQKKTAPTRTTTTQAQKRSPVEEEESDDEEGGRQPGRSKKRRLERDEEAPRSRRVHDEADDDLEDI